MLQVGDGEERAFFFKQLDDDGVGFEDGESFVGLGLAAAEARCRSGDRQSSTCLGLGGAVALAGGEVVNAMGGRGVDGAGSLVGGDIGGQ